MFEADTAQRWARINHAQERFAQRERQIERMVSGSGHRARLSKDSSVEKLALEELALPSAKISIDGSSYTAELLALQAENFKLRRKLHATEFRRATQDVYLSNKEDVDRGDNLPKGTDYDSLSKQLRAALARLEISTQRERQWQRIFVNVASVRD